MALDDKTKTLVRQLLTLAINAGAMQGEADTAACKAALLLRKAGASIDDFGSIFGAPREAYREQHRPPPPPRDAPGMMPFGKYKGQHISHVARVKPDYLRWMLANLKDLNPNLRRAIESALDAQAE